MLTATVGTEDDADAFVIALTDESGANVTELPAGDYTINVSDFLRDAQLPPPRRVGSTRTPRSRATVTEVTWEVTLEAGDYTFKCDPHANMVGG